METNYPRQFPDLMRGRTILYVHGFGSSAQSGTVKRLQTLFPETRVVAEDLPLLPDEALALLRRLCEEQQPDLVIGTSMGGMYAEQLHGYHRILVNPAFEMADTMHEHGLTGHQVFHNPRKDGVQEFMVTKPLIKAYRTATEACFQAVDDAERQRVWGLFGTEDTMVHTFDLFRRHYPQALHFHGGHRLDDSSLLHGIVPVIRWVSDRLEGRTRPIVYIDFEALCDAAGRPVSSMRKAVEHLIEHYAVYVYAAAPTNDHAFLTRVQQWVEEHIGTPLHDRVVFTNQPALLYGDYLVSPAPPADSMATTLRYGSETFKTWEEILEYYDRLGGQ